MLTIPADFGRNIDEKKTQDEAEAKKAEKSKEDEEKRLQEKIKKAKQGRG